MDESVKLRVTDPKLQEEEIELDRTLRPRSFQEFVGQEKMRENLSVFVKATLARGEALEHVLFYGPPGLGKTTMAHVLSYELGVPIKTTSGPVIERSADLAGLLTSLEKREILFIDEIHRLPKPVEEYLYQAMEEYKIDIIIDRGPGAKAIKLNLSPFTLIGATTRAGMITSPLLARFGMSFRLDYYFEEELEKILKRSAALLKIASDEKGIKEIAKRSRGTPRVANRLLRRVRDYAQIKGDGKVNYQIAEYALNMLEVDQCGLDDMDKRILKTIMEKFTGGPVGIKTLSMSVGEEAETIEEIYEPYLLREGFIERTPRGRMITPKGLKHLNLAQKSRLF